MNILSFNSVKDKKSTFIAMTSLHVEEFEKLLVYFELALAEYRDEKGYNPEKGGRKPILKDEREMLFFILFYLKTYPLQEVIAHLFGMSQGQANYWIHELSIVLTKALEDRDYMPERVAKELMEKLENENVLDISLDGTERRINRPQDHEEQKKKYSGKKKHIL